MCLDLGRDRNRVCEAICVRERGVGFGGGGNIWLLNPAPHSEADVTFA